MRKVKTKASISAHRKRLYKNRTPEQIATDQRRRERWYLANREDILKARKAYYEENKQWVKEKRINNPKNKY